MPIRKRFRNFSAPVVRQQMKPGWGVFELADARDKPVLIGVGPMPDALLRVTARMPYLRRYRTLSLPREQAIERYLAEARLNLEAWDGEAVAEVDRTVGPLAPVPQGKLDRIPPIPKDLGLWWDGVVIPLAQVDRASWRERAFEAACPGGSNATLNIRI